MTLATEQPDSGVGAPIPRSFFEYAKSMGPGIVAVLTWLGAGDIVNSAMAGGSYGYALMWPFVICLIIRYLFVSTIAKYQLCNPQGETVLSRLTRLHPWFAPFLLVWPMLGQEDFAALTLAVSAAQVIIIPVLVIAFWMITVRTKYIGPMYRNRW